MKLFKLIASLYFITLVSLFFYSFTQVDLSLTLTQASIFKDIISTLQYLGVFQRELSAIIFALISFLLFLFYFLFLNQSKKISGKMLFSLICGIFFILVLSYNAFSYDLFNYIFDAKILTFFLNQSKKISGKMLFSLICGIFFILVLSYNAFSYDLFNYIFDAKILTFYH